MTHFFSGIELNFQLGQFYLSLAFFAQIDWLGRLWLLSAPHVLFLKLLNRFNKSWYWQSALLPPLLSDWLVANAQTLRCLPFIFLCPSNSCEFMSLLVLEMTWHWSKWFLSFVEFGSESFQAKLSSIHLLSS